MTAGRSAVRAVLRWLLLACMAPTLLLFLVLALLTAGAESLLSEGDGNAGGKWP